MPREVLAACSQCGRLVQTGISIGDGVVGARVDNVITRCPTCSGTVKVPSTRAPMVSTSDLEFDLASAGGVELLRALRGLGNAKLVRIRMVLERAHESDATPEETIEQVRQESDDFGRLVRRFIGKHGLGVIGILLSIITFWITLNGAVKAEDLNHLRDQIGVEHREDLDELREQIIDDLRQELEMSDRSSGQLPSESEKIGRNDLCHCGSGNKYKRCCGKR